MIHWAVWILIDNWNRSAVRLRILYAKRNSAIKIQIECIVSILKFFLLQKCRKILMRFINLKVSYKKNYSLFVSTVKYNAHIMHFVRRILQLANVLGEKNKQLENTMKDKWSIVVRESSEFRLFFLETHEKIPCHHFRSM